MMRTAILAMTAVLAGAGAGQAQEVHPGDQVGLGLTGPGVPQTLKDARANPYALPQSVDCPVLLQQISALDQVLGADLDAPQVRASSAPDPMAGIRSIIPYAGVVRMVTGAGHREKVLVDAAMAGWERRGFLKGTARMMGCAVFGQPANSALAYPSPPPPTAAPR